jgi:thiol-disulfide isomerase/thioredoxin
MAKQSKKKTDSSKNSNGKKSDGIVEINVPKISSSSLIPVAILLSAVIVSFAVIYTGSKLNSDESTLGTTEESGETTDNGGSDDSAPAAQTPGKVVREFETFTEYDSEICKEDGKPVVYLFSTTWCPHCEWIADTFDSWAKENSDKVTAYHWELDLNDNTLTDEVESEVPDEHNDVYESFNPNGSIPTFVFGCRYGRVGNGYEAEEGLDKELETFDNLLKEIT